MIERFVDFIMRVNPADLIDPILELRSFGRCLVERIVELKEINREAVSLYWPYMNKKHRVDMFILSKREKYKPGGNVQIIESRTSFDKEREEFFTTLSNPLMGKYKTVTHRYFARPMMSDTDLLADNQLNPVNHKILSKLDPVILCKVEDLSEN